MTQALAFQAKDKSGKKVIVGDKVKYETGLIVDVLRMYKKGKAGTMLLCEDVHGQRKLVKANEVTLID